MSAKINLFIEKRNSEISLRPRFTIELKENKQEVLNRFADEFKKETTKFRGSFVDGHLFISVSKKNEHFWSPQLHLEIVEYSNLKRIIWTKTTGLDTFYVYSFYNRMFFFSVLCSFIHKNFFK